jgi:Fe-S-cluster containining protein
LRLSLGLQPKDVRRWLGYHGEVMGENLILQTPCKKLKHGRCEVYEDRPEVCQRFEVGGPSCVEAIQKFGGMKVQRILDAINTQQPGGANG